MARPVIGICTVLERASWSVWDQQAALLPSNYLEAIRRACGFALMLAPDLQLQEEPGPALDLIDGLILAGGADIDPALYGADPHPDTVDTLPQRDAFEIALTRAAIERDLPVLGICRGMQLINVALGGTLHQHLPDLLSHGEHRRVLGSFNGAEHDVQVASGSLAASVIGEATHVIRSHHHQGVDRLGEGLVASATAPVDGLVEALELPGRRFVLGVQWHPEADENSPVIEGLVAAARKFASERATQSAPA